MKIGVRTTIGVCSIIFSIMTIVTCVLFLLSGGMKANGILMESSVVLMTFTLGIQMLVILKKKLLSYFLFGASSLMIIALIITIFIS